MKLSISLATLNGHGASASIITRGVFGGDLDIAGGTHTSPAEACALAAQALRDAADRFDLLAAEAIKVRRRSDHGAWFARAPT